MEVSSDQAGLAEEGQSASVTPFPWFAYSGEHCGQLESFAWNVVCASVTGPGHAARGDGCDDAAAAGVTGDGWLIAVVCDGCGSAEFGGEGAALVSSTLLESLRVGLPEPRERLLSQILRDSLSDARTSLVNVSIERNVEVQAFASTVLGVICHRTGGILFHIGDGTGLVVDDTSGRTVISHGTPKEYANETHFLTDEAWHESLMTLAVPGTANIFLMTDGVTPFAVEAGAGKQSFFEPIGKHLATHPLQQGAEALSRMLARQDAQKQVSDDKTLLWASNRVGKGMSG